MNKEDWIKEAKEKIKSNKEFIEYVDDMVGTDYSRHRSQRQSTIRENKFLLAGIELMGKSENNVQN